jgi:hypothetical protein
MWQKLRQRQARCLPYSKGRQDAYPTVVFGDVLKKQSPLIKLNPPQKIDVIFFFFSFLSALVPWCLLPQKEGISPRKNDIIFLFLVP